MIEVRQSADFQQWLVGLKDTVAQASIAARLRRASRGNLGDVKPVGGGVSEMRIDHGPGYRLYFVQRGAVLIVLLCGGTKKSQDRDITRARELAKEV